MGFACLRKIAQGFECCYCYCTNRNYDPIQRRIVLVLSADRAGYGSRVRLLDLKKSVEVEYKLVTSEEADAPQGLISTTSPIGKALLGRTVGDKVKVHTPAGIKEFEVVKLKTIHEDHD